MTEFLDSDEIDVGSINVVTDDVVEVYFKKTVEDDLPAGVCEYFRGLFHHLVGAITSL